jgi:hypothetical protein
MVTTFSFVHLPLTQRHIIVMNGFFLKLLSIGFNSKCKVWDYNFGDLVVIMNGFFFSKHDYGKENNGMNFWSNNLIEDVCPMIIWFYWPFKFEKGRHVLKVDIKYIGTLSNKTRKWWWREHLESSKVSGIYPQKGKHTILWLTLKWKMKPMKPIMKWISKHKHI